MNKQQKTNAAQVTIGVSVAAAAAAATAGALFLFGTKAGKVQRKKIQGWMLKAKGEVLEKLETLKEVNEDVYTKVVNNVAEKYARLKNIDPAELTQLISEVRGHWKHIAKQLSTPAKKTKKKAVAKKTTNPK